ncbi:unnamed protein product [Cyprideis torosa]|uniref:Uncharacterized protein n=1 Tax=Cyprideis torosa TaxID=163714 RepID=A0A7R8WJD8_9CRUS|nr:unnamed protein product [Cyprideis torosa]CAG0901852.1 unnamed protein product [Cyprideis torosa]
MFFLRTVICSRKMANFCAGGDRFVGDISEAYAKYRPVPPSQLIEFIVETLKAHLPEPFSLAADVGCGSGQCTELLAPFFQRVVGIDPSESQLKEARMRSCATNVEYLRGDCSSLPLSSCSVDLITACQAGHWFDLDAFYSETKAALKPGGIVALIGYSYPSPVLPDTDKGNEVLQRMVDAFWSTTGPHWEKARQHVDEEYRQFRLPFEDNIIKRGSERFIQRQEMSLSDFVGYMSSSSGFHTYAREKGIEEAYSFLESIALKAIQDIGLSTNLEETRVVSEIPYFALLSRKPLQEEVTDNPCEKGWLFNFFNGKCLYFQNGDLKNWYEARYICRSMGGALASFQDRQDLLFLSQIATIGGSSLNSTRMLAWIGGYSTPGHPWAWDSGEPWGNADLHIQSYENPAKEDTCLAVTYDDKDGAVYINPDQEDERLQCGGTLLHYICQKEPVLVDGINKFNHYPLPTLPLPEAIENSYNKPQQSYSRPPHPYSPSGTRNPYQPFLRGRTEDNVKQNLDIPSISVFEVANEHRFKRSVVTHPYQQQGYSAPQNRHPGPKQVPYSQKPNPYKTGTPSYGMGQTVPSDVQIIKKHASKILQQELAYKWRPCPNGWTYYWAVDKCYYTSKNELRTWEESRERCRAVGGTVGNVDSSKSFSAWTGGHYVEGKGWRWDDEDEVWGDMDEHIHDEYYENPPVQNLCMAVFNDDARGAGLVDPYTRIPYDCKSYRMPFVCSMPPIRPSKADKGYYGMYQKALVSQKYPALNENDVDVIRTYVKAKLSTVGKMSYYPDYPMKKTRYEKSKECWVGLASINGEPWKWDDGSAIDVEEHVPILISPETNNTCVAVYPDDWYGAGYGRYQGQAPARDLSERLDCHRDRRPFICQKDPPYLKKQKSHQETVTQSTYVSQHQPHYSSLPSSSQISKPYDKSNLAPYSQQFEKTQTAYNPRSPGSYNVGTGASPSSGRYPSQLGFWMF